VESQEFIASNICPDYMRKAENRRREELERVQYYLDQNSESKVREVVETELIAKHMHTLVHVCHTCGNLSLSFYCSILCGLISCHVSRWRIQDWSQCCEMTKWRIFLACTISFRRWSEDLN